MFLISFRGVFFIYTRIYDFLRKMAAKIFVCLEFFCKMVYDSTINLWEDSPCSTATMMIKTANS